MARKGSQKGSQFERDICRTLSLWFTENENDSVFWRTSQSGGRAKLRGRKGKQTSGQHGDISAIDPIGVPLINAITFELKFGYTGSSIQDLFDRTTSKNELLSWVAQVQESQEQGCTKDWLIIWKRNRSELMCFSERLLFDFVKPEVFAMLKHQKGKAIYMFPFADFLRIKPSRLLDFYKGVAYHESKGSLRTASKVQK